MLGEDLKQSWDKLIFIGIKKVGVGFPSSSKVSDYSLIWS